MTDFFLIFFFRKKKLTLPLITCFKMWQRVSYTTIHTAFVFFTSFIKMIWVMRDVTLFIRAFVYIIYKNHILNGIYVQLVLLAPFHLCSIWNITVKMQINKLFCIVRHIYHLIYDINYANCVHSTSRYVFVWTNYYFMI